jgi:signal transduction histidine kinase
VRTPLHQILSTLELALDGQLDEDTRDNLSKSYSASRALVHVINDLLVSKISAARRLLRLHHPFVLLNITIK